MDHLGERLFVVQRGDAVHPVSSRNRLAGRLSELLNLGSSVAAYFR